MKTKTSKPSKAILICALLSLIMAGCLLAQNGQLTRVNQLADTVAPPRVVSITGTPVQVLTNNASRTSGRVLIRTIQNTGTTPFLYSIGTSSLSTSSYHGVVPGSSGTARDGLGGQVNLSAIPGDVWVMAESGGATIAIVELIQN